MIQNTISRQELIALFRKAIKKEYRTLTFAERRECLNVLIENAQTDDLNLRTLLKVMDCRVRSKELFTHSAMATINAEWTRKLVKDLTDKNRISEIFCETTGLSRATFFRHLAAVKKVRR